MSRIFIFSSEIAQLEGISKKRASHIKHLIMDAYGKQSPHKLTIAEYCKYRGISEQQLRIQLKENETFV